MFEEVSTNTNNLKLGEEQEKVLEMLKTFVTERKDPACLYYGSAGTGKSILANYFINWCEQKNISYTLCAPTHKAALVLSRYTNRDAITLHKLLSLSPKIDIFALDFNNLMFYSKGYSADMPYKGVIICDESSMINDDLYDVLLAKAKEFDNQIVFTGE
jgi:exodeoxyribonuclease V